MKFCILRQSLKYVERRTQSSRGNIGTIRDERFTALALYLIPWLRPSDLLAYPWHTIQCARLSGFSSNVSNLLVPLQEILLRLPVISVIINLETVTIEKKSRAAVESMGAEQQP